VILFLQVTPLRSDGYDSASRLHHAGSNAMGKATHHTA
jgi:hypothetical protein